MIKIAKFGGSSLADAAQFQKVKRIVESDETRAVVVVSAPGKQAGGGHKVTDLLYLCHAHLKYGVSYESIFSMVEERFYAIREGCGLTLDLGAEFYALRSEMDRDISVDYLVSRGEYLAAKLMAEYLGFAFLDAKSWLCFRYDGKVDYEKSNALLKEALLKHRRLVIPGFYGAMPDGRVRVMARGGSDVTGAVAAAAAGADVCENWTDVSGILMADPRIVKDPRPIARITYSELRELSYMGADVLHEETVFPVREKRIPLNIKNTNDPEAPGTLIEEAFEEENSDAARRFITGISGRKNYSVITVCKAHMSGDAGVLRRVIEIFERYGVGLEHIPSGVDSFSVVVSAERVKNDLYDIIAEIRARVEPDSVKVTENISLVAAVGRRMIFRPGISGRLFGALGESGVNIRMIAQGPEEVSIVVGVDNADFEKTIRVLYDRFVG